MASVKINKINSNVFVRRTNDDSVVVHRGYQPKVSNLNVTKPPKGGSGLVTKRSPAGKTK